MRAGTTAKKLLSALASLAIAAAVGCGGGSQSAPAPAGVQSAQSGTLQFSFKFSSTSSQAHARDPKFFSPNANSVVINVNGISITLGGSTSGSCTGGAGGTGKVCTVNINVPTGQITYNGTVYDGSNGTGNALGTFSGTANITAGQATPVTVTVNGTIASVVVAAVSGASLAPCVLAAGVSGNCGITVIAKDAAGFTIIPPGNFSNGPITLAITGDTASFAFTSSSQTTLNAPVQFTGGSNILVAYNGTTSSSGATVTASVPGLPPSAITTALLRPGTNVTPSPSPTATSGTTPSPVPSTTGGFSPQCGLTQGPGGFYYSLSLEGNVPAGGGTFNPTSSTSWFRLPTVVSTASPSPQPSFTGTAPPPTPTPAATARPVNIYFGSFTIAGSSPGSGCLIAFATQGGTPLAQTRLPQTAFRMPLAGGSASLFGFTQLAPGTALSFTGTASGAITALNLTLNSTGTSNGTFTLSDGSPGTLSLFFKTSVFIVQYPSPTPSGAGAVLLNPNPISMNFPGDMRTVTATQAGNSSNSFTFTGITCPGPGSGTITQPSPGTFTVTAVSTSSGQICSTIITGAGGQAAQLRMTL